MGKTVSVRVRRRVAAVVAVVVAVAVPVAGQSPAARPEASNSSTASRTADGRVAGRRLDGCRVGEGGRPPLAPRSRAGAAHDRTGTARGNPRSGW